MKHHILLLLIIISTNLFHGGESCFFYYKVHVDFVNHIPETYPQPVVVRCASKDDNLGNHTLRYNESWGFKFCVKPFSTLFYCNLRWGDSHLSLDAYNAMWFTNPCNKGDCTWTISLSGAGLPRGQFHYWEKQIN
ncbi:hypothetical protein OROGR_016210 [Orobanche gracilis]